MAAASALRADLTFKMAILTSLGGTAGLTAGKPCARRTAQGKSPGKTGQRPIHLIPFNRPTRLPAREKKPQRLDAAVFIAPHGRLAMGLG